MTPEQTERLAYVTGVYAGTDGDATKALFAKLERLGPIGVIAVNLFRAQKNSERAKVYRGRFRGSAYDRKQWAMNNLASILAEHADAYGLRWGWGTDPAQSRHRVVLYVDLPTGQASFHTDIRGDGPDYGAEWDGARGKSPARICRWIVGLLAAQVAP